MPVSALQSSVWSWPSAANRSQNSIPAVVQSACFVTGFNHTPGVSRLPASYPPYKAESPKNFRRSLQSISGRCQHLHTRKAIATPSHRKRHPLQCPVCRLKRVEKSVRNGLFYYWRDILIETMPSRVGIVSYRELEVVRLQVLQHIV